MERIVDIHKAAGILIKDKKLLIVRARGKSFFISPGGKIEKGESAEQALVRELAEELQIGVSIDALRSFGTWYAEATDQDNRYLQMDVFFVDAWQGDIVPSQEIEELRWIGATVPKDIELSSIFAHDVVPMLATQGLISD